jgi:hypothetical protein
VPKISVHIGAADGEKWDIVGAMGLLPLKDLQF